jgi:hypothetical protein
MKVGVLGSGEVAKVLAAGLVKHGHLVQVGTRAPSKLAEWARQQPSLSVGTFSEAASFGELVVLAVKGTAALEALALAGASPLTGKTVIDTTNPILDAAPVHGVLNYFTGPNESLLERLQHAFPDVHFVKAFNSVGSACMVNPQFAGGRPTMFICGNHAPAKAVVRGVLDQFGWESADMGMAEAARAIEPLCMLWCIPGFLRKDWVHAFKLLT